MGVRVDTPYTKQPRNRLIQRLPSRLIPGMPLAGVKDWRTKMEVLVAVGALLSGIGIGVGAGRLVLQGILALTFRRGRA